VPHSEVLWSHYLRSPHRREFLGFGFPVRRQWPLVAPNAKNLEHGFGDGADPDMGLSKIASTTCFFIIDARNSVLIRIRTDT
jgi:hypothetical protein